MTPGTPEAASSAGGSPEPRITVALLEENGQWVFKLTAQGETIALLHNASLNRWMAAGVVAHHNLHLTQEGLIIDGRKILYEAPDAVQELERILNEPLHVVPAHHDARSGLKAAPAAPPPPTDPASLAKAIHVTREGFDFHITYRTKFGETRTESLEKALEAFATMGLFKPHVSLQKTGIRLAVTEWDGTNFLEQPGVDDLEHTTPEEVEAVIKRYVVGADQTPEAVRPPTDPTHRRVVRIELARKGHDLRFHLVLHRGDGSVEEGPLLVRPNVARLQAEGLFAPGVTVSMTALNDRLIIERAEEVGGQRVKRSESYPLETDEHARAAETALNRCLKSAGTGAPPPANPASVGLSAVPTLPPPARPEPAAAPPRLAKPTPGGPPTAPARPARGTPPKPAEVTAAPAGPVSERRVPPVATPDRTEKRESPADIAEFVASVAAMSPEQANKEAFETLRCRLGQIVAINERGYPTFNVECRAKDGSPVTLELVLLAHSLLLNFPVGYLRFGPESRAYLNRLDDFISFPNYALRGIALGPAPGALLFVVSTEFASFLGGAAAREYRAQFGGFLAPPNQVPGDFELIWPLSREERLFNAVAAAARGYGLPVTADTVMLDPGRPEFLGFRKLASRGLEFRDGEDYVRFTPQGVEMLENGASFQRSGKSGLLGWALDSRGRVCALYDKQTGFTPPPDSKLVRFLSEDERQAEADGLTVLAYLPA